MNDPIKLDLLEALESLREEDKKELLGFNSPQLWIEDLGYGRKILVDHEGEKICPIVNSPLYIEIYGFRDLVGDTCLYCGEVRPPGMRSDAQFCSRKHKNAYCKKYKMVDITTL